MRKDRIAPIVYAYPSGKAPAAKQGAWNAAFIFQIGVRVGNPRSREGSLDAYPVLRHFR
jgi:hypothetical protein